MTQILIGRQLPNLKITLGNDVNKEENEDELITGYSINHPSFEEESKGNVDFVRTMHGFSQNPKVYANKYGAFITGIDLSSEDLLKKLEDRAARFGLEKKAESKITQNEINLLYSSLGIDKPNSGKNSNKSKTIRLDALHMRGVNEMNTDNIFQYFSEYGASAVEWINDYSCNVVWLDEASAARALLGTSTPLVIKKKNEIDEKQMTKTGSTEIEEGECLENEAVILLSDESSDEEDIEVIRKGEPSIAMDVDKPAECPEEPIDVPVPPGHWRLGLPHPKAKAILLRFATTDDKKLRGAEKRSHYYKKYGNPNYGGLKGLISTSRRRKVQATRNKIVVDKLSSTSERPIRAAKKPRMRLYADDEEEKKLFGSYDEKLSRSVHDRLGPKFTQEELPSSSEDEEPIHTNYRVARNTIWTQLAQSMADEDMPKRPDFREPKERVHGDLRSKIKGRRNESTSKHRSPLCLPD